MNQNELQKISDKLDEYILNIEKYPAMYFSSINSLCEGYSFLLSIKYNNIKGYDIYIKLKDELMLLVNNPNNDVYISLITNLKLEDLPSALKNFRKYCENIEFA